MRLPAMDLTKPLHCTPLSLLRVLSHALVPAGLRVPPPARLVHDGRHVLALVAVRGADDGCADGAAVALEVQVI